MGYMVKMVEKREQVLRIDNAPTFEAAREYCRDLYNTKQIWFGPEHVSAVSFYPVDDEKISILIDNGDQAAWIKDGKYYIADLVDEKITTVYPATLVASLRMRDEAPNCSPETLSLMFDADISGVTKTNTGRTFLWLRKESEPAAAESTANSAET